MNKFLIKLRENKQLNLIKSLGKQLQKRACVWDISKRSCGIVSPPFRERNELCLISKSFGLKKILANQNWPD